MATTDHITFTATATEPFVHLDNRALLISNGTQTAMFQGAAMRFVAETLEILATEGRATRKQGPANVLGGFEAASGKIILFAGPADRLVTVSVDRDTFAELRRRLDAQQHHA
jgi:hypothetical protein